MSDGFDDTGGRDQESAAIARFVFELGQLRLQERSGWRRLGIKPENVAEHSLRAAQIAFLLAEMEGGAESGIDPHHASCLAMFHDIAEIRTGDADLVAKRYVSSDEGRAVKDQTSPIGPAGKMIRKMWKEANAAKTPAGRIARDADLLDMAFTAKELMHQGHKGAEEWLKSAGENIVTDSAKHLFKALKRTTPDEWWKGS